MTFCCIATQLPFRGFKRVTNRNVYVFMFWLLACILCDHDGVAGHADIQTYMEQIP